MERFKYYDREALPDINIASEQTLEELLDERADQLMKFYGDRTPQTVEVTFTDGDGHVYKGTLYLVTEEKQNDGAH